MAALDNSEWRFVVQNPYTGFQLGELDFTDLRWSSVLNSWGEWSGTVNFDPSLEDNPIDLTTPWSTRIFVLRNEVLIECLDVWTRSRRSLSDTSFTIGGFTGGSWLKRVIIGGRNGSGLYFVQTEQQDIGRMVPFTAFLEWGYGGFGIDYHTPGDVYRDKTTWAPEDGKPYAEALEAISNLQNGFQWRFEPYMDGPSPNIRYVSGYPFLVNRDPIVAEFTDDGNGQYSGNIIDLDWLEDVSTLATDVVVWGSGEGQEKMRGHASIDTLTTLRIARTEMNANSVDPGWLEAKAESILAISDTPELAPQIKLSLNDANHPAGSYTVGDRISLIVDPHPLHPHGVQGTYRIIEISNDLTNETVDLTVAFREA